MYCYSAKLEAHSEQLGQQHAFVVRLQQNRADPDLIEQEKTVEKQLQRGKVRQKGVVKVKVKVEGLAR